jgi:hypothetical protein
MLPLCQNFMPRRSHLISPSPSIWRLPHGFCCHSPSQQMHHQVFHCLCNQARIILWLIAVLGPNFWVEHTLLLLAPTPASLTLFAAASASKIFWGGDFVSSTCPQPMPFFPLQDLIEVLIDPVPVYVSFIAVVPASHGRCTRLNFQFKPLYLSLSDLIMGPPDPPPNFLASHLVPQIAPRPVSLAPVGFIDDNCTAFLSQNLARLVPLPDTAPSSLMQLGGVHYGQQSIPLAGHALHASSINGLRGTFCVSLWGVPCMPLFLKTLLPWVLIAQIQKRIHLGCPYAMGFNWQPHTLLLPMGGISALHCLCPLAAPMFLLLIVFVGGSRIQKKMYPGGACHMASTWDSAGDLASSCCLWGALWFSIIVVP